MHGNCLQNINVISLSESALSEIKNANDFDELFHALSCCRPYWNWINIQMLEKMAADCSAAVQLINQYKLEVFSRKVEDVISEIPSLEMPADKYTEVKAIWNKAFNDLTVKDIVKQWDEIEKLFNVEETMLLKGIIDGCVEVCWLLPSHLVEQAIGSAKNNSQLGEHDDQSGIGTQELIPEVLYFKIGDTVIKDDIMSKLIVNCILL